MFTKEFKLAAVQRLERGSTIGEVARALEVSPNVLHRWRREIRQGPGNVFPGHTSTNAGAQLREGRSGLGWNFQNRFHHCPFFSRANFEPIYNLSNFRQRMVPRCPRMSVSFGA
jgi:hypothetical protein